MRDFIIRQAFHNSVLKSEHESSDTFIVDELGLKNGSFRADIAVLNGKLVGYEIKTDSDTLSRLPNQVKAYNEVFDNAYIIVGNKYIDSIQELVPEWWGIYLIQESALGEYNFKIVRKAKMNRSKDTFGLAQLLWKNEVTDILTSTYDYMVSKRATKDDLYDLLSAECSPKKLSSFVLKYLKAREFWRTSQQLP